MGIGSEELRILLALKREGYIPNNSTVIEIGAQQLNDTFIASSDDIAATGKLFGANGSPPAFARHGSRDINDVLAGAPLARNFWTWLGLKYAAIDVDGSVDSIPLDLNHDEVPRESLGRYGLVTNFGTTEHIANQLQAFKIIHDLTELDGLMMHAVPTGGMFEHGFATYNPKFFWMLGRSNGYKIVLMTIDRSGSERGLPADVIDYCSGFDAKTASRFADYSTEDLIVRVVFQKRYQSPFVAPIDVPNDAMVENAALRERYWSVLKPEAFVAYERHIRERQLFERRYRKISGVARRWLYARSPDWLIAIKRKIFGVSKPKSQ
jgi:hypothetical protein